MDILYKKCLFRLYVFLLHLDVGFIVTLKFCLVFCFVFLLFGICLHFVSRISLKNFIIRIYNPAHIFGAAGWKHYEPTRSLTIK